MKIAHILSKREFADIFENGKKASGSKVSLYFKRGSGAGRLSVGIVISKKAVPKAVKRNYLRRLIYVYWRENAKPAMKDMSIVVRITGGVKGLGKGTLSKTVREELTLLSARCGIMK